MRSALPLLIAGGSLALLPLLAPTTGLVAGGLERVPTCLVRQETPFAVSRDWLGSLHGWQDSVLVQSWRAGVARAKGNPGPAACQAPEPAQP